MVMNHQGRQQMPVTMQDDFSGKNIFNYQAANQIVSGSRGIPDNVSQSFHYSDYS